MRKYRAIVWGDLFASYIRIGQDPSSAAHSADFALKEWEKRLNRGDFEE